ncbi:MAG: hypothetical protein WA793_11935 [Sphingorhabdus sp.]|uniref:hypothetical protein n=1 Tax=Sphingorhabdus sp. TaxID=1902408 RepID=UPI003C974DCD
MALTGIVVGLIGLVRLWQRKPSTLALLFAVGTMSFAGLVGFTAETWFDWFGRYRGDGQILIGYLVFGAGAFLGAIIMVVLAALVAVLRPKTAATVATPDHEL